ncbi:MAG TPA: hypothetical protein VMI92_04585 [Steroidobacteraceae bacterium]|nr:hypothetical protein [Steroidobacteraceae bacterium]
MRAAKVDSPAPDLEALLASLGAGLEKGSLGPDIDAANVELLDPAVAPQDKQRRFRQWASRYQPCMFGRLGALGLAGIRYDMCWLDRATLCRGRAHVRQLIQQARLEWKERAAHGVSHGFLILFNAPELAYLPQGAPLLQVCRELCDLYLIEHAPVAIDTIYSESVPLQATDGSALCLRGGINVFYGGAHRTRNHDRRIPGGIMISVNSPGLLAHSLVRRGLAPDLPAALERVRNLAWASIGNGGISRGAHHAHSCSWHNTDAARASGECPMKHRPRHVPEDFATDRYSAMYHTDVLLPGSVMQDPERDQARGAGTVWGQLDFGYLSAHEHDVRHENFGFVQGQAVAHEARFEHRWAPHSAPALADQEVLS